MTEFQELNPNIIQILMDGINVSLAVAKNEAERASASIPQLIKAGRCSLYII